jgi:hypothetical protein
VLATLLVVSLPPLIKSQQPARGSGAQGILVHDQASLAGVGRAIGLSARYLESACGKSGKFAYRLDPDSGQLSSSYNIVRHAGAMYALAGARHKSEHLRFSLFLDLYPCVSYTQGEERQSHAAIYRGPGAEALRYRASIN